MYLSVYLDKNSHRAQISLFSVSVMNLSFLIVTCREKKNAGLAALLFPLKEKKALTVRKGTDSKESDYSTLL